MRIDDLVPMTQQMRYNHPYNGPSEEYGKSNWNKRRFAIFKAMGYKCSLCGRYAKGDLHLHHIVPIKISHNNNSNNLQPLCSACHYMVHKDYIERKRRFEID